MRTLVTGAAGFVGARLVERLVRDGHDVVAVIRPGSRRERLDPLLGSVKLLAADLSQPGDVNTVVVSGAVDVAYHLAWYTEPGVYPHAVRENLGCVRSSLLFVEALLDAGCRHLVVTGSCAEYGLSSEPLTERSPTRPHTVYGATKLALQTAARAAAAAAGATLAWARIFYLYGPGEDRRRPVPRAVLDFLEGRTVPVVDPDDVRDYLHVDDVAAALTTLGSSGFSGIANVCSGVPTTQRELLSVLAELSGGLLGEEVASRDAAPMRTQGRATALRRLGWRPTYDLRGGLADTVRWWSERSSPSAAGTSSLDRR